MLNLLFACFLFGLLCAVCIRGLYRAVRFRQDFTAKEYALLTALFTGTLLSAYMALKN